jgi:hypothetical protein
MAIKPIDAAIKESYKALGIRKGLDCESEALSSIKRTNATWTLFPVNRRATSQIHRGNGDCHVFQPYNR